MIQFPNMKRTVVCFGDSITRGEVSANYIDLLEERFSPQDFSFVNAGVNNDLSYNLLLRMDEVISQQPDFVTVLIGTNDVIATIQPLGALYDILRKQLNRWPNLEWSTHNLIEVIHCLKSETHAHIAVASIPVLGEDLTSLPNRRVSIYNQRAKKIAAREGVDYLPVFERQVDFLNSDGTPRKWAYTGSVALTAEFLVRHYLAQESLDEYSRRKGFELLTDSVHMNSQGAALIADEIEKFLRKY